MKINSFGLCFALRIDHKIFEKIVEGLILRLQSEDELYELPATQNCLSLMKNVGDGYARRFSMTYYSAARLLYNLESLMIRLMSRTNGSVYIEIDRLKSILFKAAESDMEEKIAESAIGDSIIKVGIGSRYFNHLLHMEFNHTQIDTMKRNLAIPGRCDLLSIASKEEINEIAKELDKFQPRKIQNHYPGGSFSKLVRTLYYENIDTYELDKETREFIKARNRTSHLGYIPLDETKLDDILKHSFTCLALAGGVKVERNKQHLFNVIKYCITNPIDGFVYSMRGILIGSIILLLTWVFVPTPKPQKMTYPLEGVGGQMERLFEGFARQDTTTVLDIYGKANIIIETIEAIK